MNHSDKISEIRKAVFFLLTIVVSTSVYGQSVTNIQATQDEKKIIITYDLSGSRSQLFSVKLFVSEDGGFSWKGPLRAVTGDVGSGVNAWNSKKIIWDVISEPDIDHIKGDQIVFKVAAEPQYFHRETALLYSAIVPGLGITKLNKGKPYWLMAVAFYGAAAGSYIYYNSASKTFDKYLASEDENERNTLYDQSKSKKTISTVLMYTVGAVWLGNIIWTAVYPNKTKPEKNSISLGAGWNERFGMAELSVKCNF
ncbi:MAG: hypothetical protein WCM93_11170 [Bacteroidota bacterium]